MSTQNRTIFIVIILSLLSLSKTVSFKGFDKLITNLGSPKQSLVLFSEIGFHTQTDKEWADFITFASSEAGKLSLMVFSNISLMPIRSNYYLSSKVSHRVFTHNIPSIIKMFFWLDPNVSHHLTKLKYVGRFDDDIFVFFGEEQFLGKLFTTPEALKIKYKCGVITKDNSNLIRYMTDPVLFSHGDFHLSNAVPTFHHNSIRLNGYNLKVSANALAPYIMYKASGEITGGTNYMMLKYASEHYNFTLNWDIDPLRGNGRLVENGSANGMLGDVLSGEFDIALIARLAQGQVGIIDLTEVNSIDTLVFLTRQPEAHLEWVAVIRIFTPDAWGLIFLSFLAVIPIFYLSIHVDQFTNYRHFRMNLSKFHSQSMSESIYKAVKIPYEIALSQSVPYIPSTGYLISVFWMIFILNINTGYNSNLSSFLTSLTAEKIPTDFEELSKRLDYNLTFNYLSNGSCDCFHFFNNSVNPTIIKIKERFMSNLEPDTGKCILDAVLNKKAACIGWASVSLMGIARNATLYQGLNLVRVSKSVHSSLNSIGFQRHSIYTRAFSRFISMYRDMGIVTKLRKDAESQELAVGKAWIHKRKKSQIYKVLTRMEEDRRTVVRPFDIDNFLLSFLILFGGLGLSTFVLVLEKLMMRHRGVVDLQFIN